MRIILPICARFRSLNAPTTWAARPESELNGQGCDDRISPRIGSAIGQTQAKLLKGELAAYRPIPFAAAINLVDMQPHNEQSHCATRPSRYALEMNRGWFAERGIKPGAKLRGIEKLSAPR